MARASQNVYPMIRFGKQLAFIAMVLAILCVIPITVYNTLCPDDRAPEALAATMVLGTPVFAILSLVGLLIWALGEIRRADKRKP
jgi:H+/gluconate symporter-like permease